MKKSELIEALEMIRDWPDEAAKAMGYDIAFHALKSMAKAVLSKIGEDKE